MDSMGGATLRRVFYGQSTYTPDISINSTNAGLKLTLIIIFISLHPLFDFPVILSGLGALIYEYTRVIDVF